jgi:hypothetical protein
MPYVQLQAGGSTYLCIYKKDEFLDVIGRLGLNPRGPAVCESIEGICCNIVWRDPLRKPDSAREFGTCR